MCLDGAMSEDERAIMKSYVFRTSCLTLSSVATCSFVDERSQYKSEKPALDALRRTGYRASAPLFSPQTSAARTHSARFLTDGDANVVKHIAFTVPSAPGARVLRRDAFAEGSVYKGVCLMLLPISER